MKNRYYKKQGTVNFRFIMHSNGYKMVQVKTGSGTTFTIPTNGNLPYTHKTASPDAKEIVNIHNEILSWIDFYGSENKKNLVSQYNLI